MILWPPRRRRHQVAAAAFFAAMSFRDTVDATDPDALRHRCISLAAAIETAKACRCGDCRSSLDILRGHLRRCDCPLCQGLMAMADAPRTIRRRWRWRNRTIRWVVEGDLSAFGGDWPVDYPALLCRRHGRRAIRQGLPDGLSLRPAEASEATCAPCLICADQDAVVHAEDRTKTTLQDVGLPEGEGLEPAIRRFVAMNDLSGGLLSMTLMRMPPEPMTMREPDRAQ